MVNATLANTLNAVGDITPAIVHFREAANVGARVADANTHSIGSALSSTARTDTPTELPMPQPVENAPSPIQATALSSHQSALFALSLWNP